MPNIIESTKINAAFYHSLGKVLTEVNNLVGNEKYKSAHNVRSSEIWMDPVPYAPLPASASQYSDDIVVKQVGTSSNPYYIYPLTQTNYQTWFIDVGTPTIFPDGFEPSTGWVKPLINPSDVPNEAGAPSFGYELQMFQRNGTPISYGSAFYDVDYFSGLIRFDLGRTPKDTSSGLGFQFSESGFSSATDKINYIKSELTGGPRVIAWQYVGKTLADFEFSSGLTAGQGLTISNGDISINIGTQSGLTFSQDDELNINVDNQTIKINQQNQIYVSGNSVYQTGNPSITNGNGSSTGITISYTPLSYSTVKVYVNGQSILLGSTTASSVDCYFSSDSGSNAKDYEEIVTGDELYFNGDSVGYELNETDRIVFIYEANI
jgi:hypothetical protein